MKKVKYLSLMAIMMLVLAGCGKSEEKIKEPVEGNQNNGIVLKENLDIEINSEVNLLSLIDKGDNVVIVSKDENIDTSTLGEKELVIKYKEDDKENELSFKIKVIDTQTPIITFQKELSTKVGTKIDLLENVKVSDNSKENIKVTVAGDYDFSKAGTYKLKYLAIDSSNNKCEEDFTLTVTKKTTTSSNNSSSDKPSSNSTPSTGGSTSPSSNNTPASGNNQPQDDTSNNNEEANDKSASKLITSATHKYQVNYTYAYVKKTDIFNAKSKQDILNIFYTALNEGADAFSFYCDYSSCKDDLEKIGKNGDINYVQDFVHPYNTFKLWQYSYDNTNLISVKITKTYSNSDITKLENKVNSIINSKVTSSLSLVEKIKVLHDYLVENTSYQDNGSAAQQTAIGPLINGKSVCEGYSHAMAIFLYKLKVSNYRVSTPGVHMWNLAYVGGKWQHIDATWDDPLYKNASGNRQEILIHDFFLVNSSVIKNKDTNQEHNFNKNIYKEA